MTHNHLRSNVLVVNALTRYWVFTNPVDKEQINLHSESYLCPADKAQSNLHFPLSSDFSALIPKEISGYLAAKHSIMFTS